MENLTVQVMNTPVIVYPGAFLAGGNANGALVEGVVQFDLAHQSEVDIKVRLMGTERQNKMLHHDQKTGEVELIDVGQSLPLFRVETELIYMFFGGKVPCTPTLSLQPGNHIFAFSGRIPHSTPSSEVNSYVTTTYEAVAIAHGRRSSGWLKHGINKSASKTFEVRVQPSPAGPNEANKLDERLKPVGIGEEDVPIKAFVRSNNARLGGCMDLNLSIYGPVSTDFRLSSISLELEQSCHINTKAGGSFERVVCTKTLLEEKDVIPVIHKRDEEEENSNPTSRGDRKPHINGHHPQHSNYGTLTLRTHFPNVGSMSGPGDHTHDWIVSTPPKTHTNLRFCHKLRLRVGLKGSARLIDYSGETFELQSDVVLVDYRLSSEDVILPSYGNFKRRITEMGPVSNDVEEDL